MYKHLNNIISLLFLLLIIYVVFIIILNNSNILVSYFLVPKTYFYQFTLTLNILSNSVCFTRHYFFLIPIQTTTKSSVFLEHQCWM